MSPVIGLLGASGYTGGLVASLLADRGLPLLAAGRRRDRVETALGGRSVSGGIREVDLHDDASLRSFLGEVDLVINAVGPYDRLGRGVVAAAVEAGTDYVDVAVEPAFLSWASATWDEAARGRDVRVVPGAGLQGLVGDLLAALAAAPLADVEEVHVAYATPGARRGARSVGHRATLAGLLAAPVPVRVDGRDVEERLAEARRLAWFPRPVGPRHAAATHGGEPLTVPRHLPGVRTVRTYTARSTGASEATQALGGLACWEPAGRLLRAVAGRGAPGSGPDAATRAATRWACVVEAATSAEVGRAWAYGHDPHGTTAAIAVAVAEQLLAGRPAPGVLPPAAVTDPGALLDELAARTDLRWGRARSPRPDR